MSILHDSARRPSGHTIAARTAAALVALVAGAASYEHISAVALGAGERTGVAYGLPLAIDGLIVVGVAALLEDRKAGLRPRPVARLAVVVGVVATLAANIASAQPTLTGRLVAVAAPVAFLLSVEVLTRSGRVRPGAAAEPVRADAAAVQEAEPAPVPDPSADPAPEPVVTRPEPPQRQPRVLTNAERVTAAHRREPGASHARIAHLAGVSPSTAKRHRPAGSPSGQGAAETTVQGGSREPVGVGQ